jgi:hypothetical protein
VTAAARVDGTPPVAWHAALALAILAAYLAMTPPVAGDGDCGEFTIVLARAALAHPSGYPLYTLVGHAFCVALHAAGASYAFAAGAWSALGGALAAFFFMRLADALVEDAAAFRGAPRFLASAVPGVLLAMNPIVSFETTHAEVYAWHLAWACGAALLFVRFARVLRDGADGGRVTRFAIAWGLACGAGLAHHTTSVFYAGPTSLVLLWRLLAARPRWPRAIAACAAASLVPIASYGFVFWRAAHPSGADWVLFTPTGDGVLAHVTASGYRAWIFGGFRPTEIQDGFLSRWIFPWLVPSLSALLAAVLLARGGRERAIRGALLVGAAANLAFAFRLRVDDPSAYFLAPLAIGLASVGPLAAWLAARVPGRAFAAAASVAAAAALVTGGAWIGVGMDRRGVMIAADARLRAMWQSIPAGPGIVFYNHDMVHQLRCLQIVEGSKPELGVWHTAGLPAPIARERFRERHGIDPLAGVRAPTIDGDPREWFRSVHRDVNRRTPLPVYEFDPERESVRLLRKPAPESR